jgi:hypothetical protein
MQVAAHEASHFPREQVEQHQRQLQHALSIAQARFQAAYSRLPHEKSADLICRLDSSLAHIQAQVSAFALKEVPAFSVATIKVCNISTKFIVDEHCFKQMHILLQ